MSWREPFALLEHGGAPAAGLGPRLILAATDFSPTAAAAAARAAQLARAAGSRLALLHVVHPVGRMVAPLLDAIGAAGAPSPGTALSHLRRKAARLAAEFGVRVETHLASGSAPAAITAHAQSAGAELIVLGNREGNFLVDLLRINTAHRVRRRIALPVLAVTRPGDAPYARVLLATDLSPDAAHAGRVARRLFPSAILHVLHVCQPPYESALNMAGVDPRALADYRRRCMAEAEEQLRLFARDAALGADALLEVRLGNPAAEIAVRSRELDADVVVLHPAKSWLARGMANSVTEQVLADPPCDALLVG